MLDSITLSPAEPACVANDKSEVAVLAADVQAPVHRFSIECAQGFASEQTAERLHAILNAARRLSVHSARC